LTEQEKSFNESNRRLRESSTLSALAEAEKEFKTYKKRILACLSHELRTPLNSIYFAFRSVMDELELPQ
jgi:signal transduction histidine kinase